MRWISGPLLEPGSPPVLPTRQKIVRPTWARLVQNLKSALTRDGKLSTQNIFGNKKGAKSPARSHSVRNRPLKTHCKSLCDSILCNFFCCHCWVWMRKEIHPHQSQILLEMSAKESPTSSQKEYVKVANAPGLYRGNPSPFLIASFFDSHR